MKLNNTNDTGAANLLGQLNGFPESGVLLGQLPSEPTIKTLKGGSDE
jgi:hypothetical protein